jgi:hypothetical protein
MADQIKGEEGGTWDFLLFKDEGEHQLIFYPKIQAYPGLSLGAAGNFRTIGLEDIYITYLNSDDLTCHAPRNRPIQPGELAYGLILFPREAGPPQPPASAVARPGYRPVFSLPLPI